MNLADIVAPEFLEMAKAMVSLKAAEKTTSAYEIEIIAKDGDRIALEINSRMSYRDGEPVGVQGIARDSPPGRGH